MSRLLLLAVLLLGSCVRPPPPSVPSNPRYMLGEPTRLGGLWFYPREDFGATETGIATIIPDDRTGRRTANGEIHDPAALVGAHRTLQLPAIVTVTNLENGRVVTIRLNDRGPDQIGRVLGLSRRAAQLLGFSGVAQVRMTVESGPSQALAAALPSEMAQPAAVAAPAGDVSSERLAPLPGTREAGGSPSVPSPRRSPAEPIARVPNRLPETVLQVPARPGVLILQLSQFHRRDLALQQAARFGARVAPVGSGRNTQWRVLQGPFDTVDQADAAFARLLEAGAGEVALRVE